ncbi:MAG TPA: serine/threonine-protein kinase [Pseudonocardia sp.]|nr:serine/threonine-protein kinase [Pseudonocardia sp.]
MSDIESEPTEPPDAFRTAPSHLAGRYALGDLVGVGASAGVYRAHDERLNRDVAVKLYPPGVAGPDRIRQQQELAILAQLHHQNLVGLLDAGEEDGRAYLVMQLIEDPTLAEKLVLDGPMGPGDVARLGAQLGDALAYVHDRGITHRDVKPANVLVGDRPMLADFGIARLVDAARVTQTGYLIGTLAYLAPEQVSGGEVSTPADVYALGLTLLEALTGSREYDGDGPEAAFARLSRTPSVPEGLPVLTDLLRDMTALDPATRPSAADAARRLRDALPEFDAVAPDEWPLSAPTTAGTGPGTTGTKQWQVAAQPAGLTGRSSPLLGAETRQVRRRRLLAGALAGTATAAAVVGLVTMQGTSAAVPVPAMSVPTLQIGEPGPQVAVPVAQLPSTPSQAAVPGPGAGSSNVSGSTHVPGRGVSTARDSAVGDSGKKESKRSGKHSSRSDPDESSSGGNGGSSGGASDSSSSTGAGSDSSGSGGDSGSDSSGSDNGGSGGSTDGGGSGSSGDGGSSGDSSTDGG